MQFDAVVRFDVSTDLPEAGALGATGGSGPR